MAKWIGDNSQAIGKTDVRSLSENYYCVSAWRLLTGFRLMEGLMTVAAWTFIRPLTGLGLLRITEERPRKGRVRMVGDVNVTRLLMVLRKLRPLKRVVEAVLPVIIRKMGPRLLRLSLTKPERMSKGDASLLIPRTMGLPTVVVVKWDQHLQIEATKVIEQATSLYHRMELHEIFPDLSKLSSQMHLPFVLDVKGRSAT